MLGMDEQFTQENSHSLTGKADYGEVSHPDTRSHAGNNPSSGTVINRLEASLSTHPNPYGPSILT